MRLPLLSLFLAAPLLAGEPAAITRIDLGSVTAPGAAALETRLRPFIGQPGTENTLAAVADAVVAHWQGEGRPYVIVSAPPEPAADGTVMLHIDEGRARHATVSGGSHLALGAWVKAARRLDGRVIDGVETQSILDSIQRHPFANGATLAAVPLATGTPEADLIFRVPERRPLRATLGYSNDGVEPLGENRWSASVLWGNAFGLGHILSLDAVSANEPDAFLAESLTWVIPLPWRHEILLAATHAASSSAFDFGGLEIDAGGDAWTGSLRYTVPWRLDLSTKGDLHAGFDYKHFDSDLTFGGRGSFSQPVESAALVAGGLLQWEKKAHAAQLGLDVVWSPGGLFSHDSAADYSAIVPGADADFLILRANGAWRWDLTSRGSQGWALQVRAGGQWADGPLLPAEEGVLTGAATVRGYAERGILGRHLVWGSAELHAPVFSAPASTRLRPLVFVDAGHAWSSAADQPDESALSAGFGMRAVVTDHFQLRCDAAWPLHHSGDGPRLHLSATLIF